MYIFLKFEKNQFSKLIMLVIIKFSNSSGSEVTEISNRPFLSGSCSNWNHDQASSRSRWFTSQRVNFGILWRFGQSWVQSLSLISLTLILAVAINYICEKTWNHIKSKLWWWLLMCNWHATWGWPMTSWTDRRTTTYSQCWGPMFRMACWSEHRQSKKVRHERWKIVQGSLHSLEYQSNDHTLGKPDVTICQKPLWLQLPVISTIPPPAQSRCFHHRSWCSTLSLSGLGFWDLSKVVSESWKMEPYMLGHPVPHGCGWTEEQVAGVWTVSWVIRINLRCWKVTRNLTWWSILIIFA